ncbi:MAG: PCRF domain-containing protein, partial [Oscillospiraceae bacterium]|nr:PCRF domain-containing protein [Oscillospiraceae bacterium]
MLVFEELRFELLESEKPLCDLKEALGLENMKKEVEQLELQAAADGFWDDLAGSQKVLQRTSMLKGKIESYQSLKNMFDDTLVMIELSDEEGDESMLEECTKSVRDIQGEIERFTLSTLLSGEYDSKNALLTFHAGAGGTEAQDWAQMLFRMYVRWGERHGFKVSTLDFLDGDEAGLKSATILIEG